ncbi:hypothetical protein JQN29_28770, partial [Klebsiella pneumoniae]|nr:hypothetical protein [Klebsiella pneumoniae]
MEELLLLAGEALVLDADLPLLHVSRCRLRGKLSYLISAISIAREEQKTLVVSTANVALQDQIYSKDLPLLKK